MASLSITVNDNAANPAPGVHGPGIATFTLTTTINGLDLSALAMRLATMAVDEVAKATPRPALTPATAPQPAFTDGGGPVGHGGPNEVVGATGSSGRSPGRRQGGGGAGD